MHAHTPTHIYMLAHCTQIHKHMLELEKVQHRVARFVYNNYWPTASVTEMISTLNWETLEKC